MEKQIGIIVFIDGEVVGLEVLAKYETFNKVHSKLVNSYVMDALETATSQKKPSNQTLKAKASKVLDAAQKAGFEVRRPVVLGNDVRFEFFLIISLTRSVAGSSCMTSCTIAKARQFNSLVFSLSQAYRDYGTERDPNPED